MDKKLYPRIGEEVIWVTLDNGLPVCIVPKKGFSRKYALFATRYGGMDMRFRLNGQWLDTPAGIAHYLEHKMFDTEDGNALQELAMNGAEPNAFTSNAITCYYFDSTEKFYENLEILLSFVSVPYFTDERGEGAGHYRSGDRHDRGQPGVAGVQAADAVPVPHQPRPDAGGRQRGEHP